MSREGQVRVQDCVQGRTNQSSGLYIRGGQIRVQDCAQGKTNQNACPGEDQIRFQDCVQGRTNQSSGLCTGEDKSDFRTVSREGQVRVQDCVQGRTNQKPVLCPGCAAQNSIAYILNRPPLLCVNVFVYTVYVKQRAEKQHVRNLPTHSRTEGQLVRWPASSQKVFTLFSLFTG